MLDRQQYLRLIELLMAPLCQLMAEDKNQKILYNTLKIDTGDLVKAVDFARSLSPGAAMSVLPIRCKVMDRIK